MPHFTGKGFEQNVLRMLKLKYDHVRPAIFRLRYGYEIKDEMIGYVKSTYKQVYRAVWSVMNQQDSAEESAVRFIPPVLYCK